MRRSTTSSVVEKARTRRDLKKGQTATVLKKTAKRKRVLRKGSDEELIRVFAEK